MCWSAVQVCMVTKHSVYIITLSEIDPLFLLSPQHTPVLLFESGSAAERVALVQEEIERLVLRCAQQTVHRDGAGVGVGAGGWGHHHSAGGGEEAAEVLDRTSFQQELGALLPLLLAYTPRRLPLPHVTEALLCHAKHAPAHLLVRT